MIGGLVPHDDTDQVPAVPLGKGDQRFPRFVRVAGLAAEDILAGDGTIEKIVGIAQPEIIGLGVRRLELIVGLAEIVHQLRVAVDLPGDHGHVVGGGIVFLVVQAVGRDKMAVGAAQLHSSFVHKIDEGGFTAGNFFAERVCHLVGGGDQKTVEGLVYCDGFSDIHADVGRAGFDPENRLLREGDLIG